MKMKKLILSLFFLGILLINVIGAETLISENGVEYDSEIFKHFFLLDEIPIEIEMRPIWKSTYEFSEEELVEIETNKKELIEYLNSAGVNSVLIYDGRKISVNVSKEVLLVLLQDKRIGRMNLPIGPETPYEFWFEKFPRDIKHNFSLLLIFLSLFLSVFLLMNYKKRDRYIAKKRRIFAFVNLSSLPFYFLYVYVLSNNLCSGKGTIWVFFVFPLIIGSLIWEFIHSIKYKISLGKIISLINILILIFIIFARSNIVCLT